MKDDGLFAQPLTEEEIDQLDNWNYEPNDIDSESG